MGSDKTVNPIDFKVVEQILAESAQLIYLGPVMSDTAGPITEAAA